MSTTRRRFLAGAVGLVAAPTVGAKQPCSHPWESTERLGDSMQWGEYQEDTHVVCNGCGVVLDGEVPIPWDAEPEVLEWARNHGVEIQPKPPPRKQPPGLFSILDPRTAEIWRAQMLDEIFSQPALLRIAPWQKRLKP